MARPRRHVRYVVRCQGLSLWWRDGRWRALEDADGGSNYARAWTYRAALKKLDAGIRADPARVWVVEKEYLRHGERWMREFVREGERG